jgi:hypothetical protein
MKWSLDYNKCTDAHEAYETVKKNITAEVIGKFKVKADISYIDPEKEFQAKGKGFKLNATFGETCVDIDLDLSFLLKPVGGKIKEILDKEMKRVI